MPFLFSRLSFLLPKVPNKITTIKYCLLMTIASVWTLTRPDILSVLIWIKTLVVFFKEFSKNIDFEKNQQTTKCMQNYPACKKLKLLPSSWPICASSNFVNSKWALLGQNLSLRFSTKPDSNHLLSYKD